MLSYSATNDATVLNSLSKEIFGEDFGAEVGFVLYDDGNPAGVARMTVTPSLAVLERIGVRKDARGKRIGDFFTRSLLFAASNVSEEIQIAYESDYFLKFGFVKGGRGMKILSEELTFPCECGKR